MAATLARRLLRNAVLCVQLATMASIPGNFDLGCRLNSLVCQTPRSPIIAPRCSQKAPSSTIPSGLEVQRQAPSMASRNYL